MAGSQLVKMRDVPKVNVNISTVVRQASCSKGWLRIVVQYIFGAITVASFVMIVMISMQTPSRDDNYTPSSCQLLNCRITCNDTTPLLYEDVFSTVAESEVLCTRVSLVFLNPFFLNDTLPTQWLSGLQSSIIRLTITGGNLRFIAPQAFMSHFAGYIEYIMFEEITIINWSADTLVGLSSLKQLNIRECNIGFPQRHALRAVDETLDVLTITQSGNWDPVNMSGSTEMLALDTVDFSFNIFNDILSNVSFEGLQNCKILYLNSCNITTLGPGTFDYLYKIEVLYLNNNLLVTIPTGLFDGVLNHIIPKPRINLQNNPWFCDCSSHDLRSLYYNDLLYIEPTCDAPEELHGESFSAISNYCANDSGTVNADVIVVDFFELQKDDSENVVARLQSDCADEISSKRTWKLQTPDEMYNCENNITLSFINAFLPKTGPIYNDITKSDWITPTYLLRHNGYSMVQMSSLTSNRYGILWFKTTCPYVIYCMSALPRFLRVYDHYVGSQYTFCPIDLENGFVRNDKCVAYDTLEVMESPTIVQTFGSVVLYICTAMVCLAIGAIFVYAIIRCNPILLKGSKRLLFVKHKNVDALVLPPKVPLRNSLSNPDPDPIFNVKTICAFPDNEKNLSPRNFLRMKSTRSDMSTVSYISALQPTEDQLAEWRVKRLFDNNLTITSDSEMSIISWVNDGSSSSEYVSSVTYESLK